MSATTVHQALHGYRRGHEFIAGSIRLPPSAAELVTRLSDLSGSVASGWKFTNYLTGYPLPESPYFALARTWEDKNAPRAGCVLTHTLLIPIDCWKTASDPMTFCNLFAEVDDLQDERRFKKAVAIAVKPFSNPSAAGVPHDSSLDFVRKYFGEGQRPLIWVDCPNPDDTVWSIIRILWPSLRAHFAWCTNSLQPRSLDTRLIDLQFAPAFAYSRFSRIPRENFIAGEVDRSRSAEEPWCAPCAEWIFSGRKVGPVDAELRAFGESLHSDPTLMRHLFLASDLSDRMRASPTAGVGLLDVTEALAPESDQAVDYKSNAVSAAINAAMRATPDEGLKCLFLVSERLMSMAFESIVVTLGAELARRVGNLASQYVREALSVTERSVSRIDVVLTPYFLGIVRGLTLCAKESPSDLVCLQEFSKIAPSIVAAEPDVAVGFLRGVRATDRWKGGRDALVEWIAAINAPGPRSALRQKLLPEVVDDRDAPLVEQLCRDLPSEEVESALTALVRGTDGFASEKVLATLQEVVASRCPEEVRKWAACRKQWPTGVVLLVSATFPLNPLGLDQIVSFGPLDLKQRVDLLTAFLESCCSLRVPGWLKDMAARSADWLLPLFSFGREMQPTTVSVLDRVIPELQEIPLASHAELRPTIDTLSTFRFWPSLVDLTLRNALSAFVRGGLNQAECEAWFSTDWAVEWVSRVSHSQLTSALIFPVNSLDDRERAFQWLATAPPALYERQPSVVPGLFWELVSERRFGWTPAMGSAWAKIIHRVRHAIPGSSTLRMCADVLRFGFDHTTDMVGAAVAAAFYPVYRSVCDSRWPAYEVANLFGWFEWDRAKELRKALVHAFMSSNWNPGDLALAAGEDEELLRKLVKRTLKHEGGTRYVTSILSDLLSRADTNMARTIETVRELAANPDFHESWD